MKWKLHVRCGVGEKSKIISKIYLSLFSCVLWKGIAETTVEYCKKGDLIGVRGRIQTRSVEYFEDQKRNIMEVVAERVTFLSSKPREAE